MYQTIRLFYVPKSYSSLTIELYVLIFDAVGLGGGGGGVTTFRSSSFQEETCACAVYRSFKVAYVSYSMEIRGLGVRFSVLYLQLLFRGTLRKLCFKECFGR